MGSEMCIRDRSLSETLENFGRFVAGPRLGIVTGLPRLSPMTEALSWLRILTEFMVIHSIKILPKLYNKVNYSEVVEK